ncbi:MAG: hypothetical protein F6K00_10540 [Leptolyngbya sp. SIOISBB]|nr:hypothetical protein [Leptolyngbya sp. SIOISBB]
MRLINRLAYALSISVVGMAISSAQPTPAAITPQLASANRPLQKTASLFDTIDLIEDVDDALDGDFLDIDPFRDVTEGVEDVVDDVTDTYNDVTDFRIWEPFTGVDDTVEDFVDDVDDTMRHISNDIDDWFD